MSLSKALNDAKMLYQPLFAENLPHHTNFNSLEINDAINCTRILEIQRLSVIFFRYLLLEGSGLSTKIFGTHDESQSSEIPVIPRYLVNAVKSNLPNISEIIQDVVQENNHLE